MRDAASSSGSGALDRASGQGEVGPAGNDGRSPDPDAAKKRPSILTVIKQEAKAVNEWPDYLKQAFGVKS